MAKRTVEESSLILVADSIRAKAGKSDKLEFPFGYKSAIDSISKSEIKNQDITITENGTYTPASGFTGFGSVKVEVESSGGSGGSMFVTSAVGFIPDIPKGYANSTLTIDFETSAVGALA